MVEPRKASRFVASDTAHSAALGGDGNAVSDFVSAMDATSRQLQTPPARDDETRTVGEDDSTARAMREPFRRDMVSAAVVAVPKTVDDGEDQGLSSETTRRPKAHPEPLLQLRAEEQFTLTERSGTLAGNWTGTDAVGLPVAAELRQPQKIGPVAATFTGPSAGEEEGLDVAARRESGEESVPPLGNGRHSAARHPPYEPMIATPSDTVVRQTDAPIEPRTEIHISIGHIELRPPPVVTRPQPASFQPRVSLDDFLGRRP
jgi:hypothetical protein